jgi:hypothetical protein
MKTVYKYKLQFVDCQDIDLPIGAQILKVKNQESVPCLWAVVDTEEKNLEKRKIRMMGTGHPLGDMPGTYLYINTYEQDTYVWHVFEIKLEE